MTEQQQFNKPLNQNKEIMDSEDNDYPVVTVCPFDTGSTSNVNIFPAVLRWEDPGMHLIFQFVF